MKPRKHKMMSFMLRMLKQAAISTRLSGKSDKAIQSSVLMSLKQCESWYFAYMFLVKLNHQQRKKAGLCRFDGLHPTLPKHLIPGWLQWLEDKFRGSYSTVRQSVNPRFWVGWGGGVWRLIAGFSPLCFQFHCLFGFFSPLETDVKYIMTDKCTYCLNNKK